MDISVLQRDAKKALSAVREDGNSLVALRRCKILVPEAFFGAQLGVLGEEIRIAGIYALIVDDKYYGVSSADALMQIEPTSTNVVDIDGLKYMEFTFEPGDRVIVNLNLVKTATLVYRVYDMMIAKGKIPWYVSYDDLALIFTTAKIHAGADLGVDNVILEMIVSSIARDPKDRMKYYRHAGMTAADVTNNPPDFIALRSVAFSATNTTAKLLGSYLQEGVSSALVSPSERTESIENLLRK